LGIIVFKDVETNLGKVNPICAASLKPSGQSDLLGLPKTAQVLYI
jgi:hypothetical protein